MFFPLPLAMPQEVQQIEQSAPSPRKLLVTGSKEYIPRVQKIAEGLDHQLPSWTIVILNDNQWKTWKKPNLSDSTFSILGANRTYIHEKHLRELDDKVTQSLAHELGHLTLNTTKEEDATKWAVDYLKAKKK